jgi:uncharacterized protein YjbJ (UPF0337 family)
MNKDTIVGTAKEISGKVHSAVSHVTGNKEGEAHGNMKEAEGKMQKNYGKVKDIVKDVENS